MLSANWIKREAVSPTHADDLLQSRHHLAHGKKKHRKRQKRSDPESSSQIVQFTVILRHGARRHRFQRHPADRAGAWLSEMTSGCIGQVYLPADATVRFFSGAIPHCGHDSCSVFADCGSAFIENLLTSGNERAHGVARSTNSDGCIGLAFGCFESWPITQVWRWLVRSSTPSESSADRTAEIWFKISTQYRSSSIMRWIPATWPAIRLARRRILSRVLWSIAIHIPGICILQMEPPGSACWDCDVHESQKAFAR